jgi:hypothetical protein
VEGFDTVREIELARHCCLHNEGSPTKHYEKQTAQRLLDANGIINLTPDQLDSIVGELSQFGKSLNALTSDIWKETSQNNNVAT